MTPAGRWVQGRGYDHNKLEEHRHPSRTDLDRVRWVALERAKSDVPPPAFLDADERAELERLRVEVGELRMDREFLKKAAAFFATENHNR